MSFLNIDTGSGFISTLYNVSTYIAMCILFGLALNVEHYQDKVRFIKRVRRLDKALSRLDRCDNE